MQKQQFRVAARREGEDDEFDIITKLDRQRDAVALAMNHFDDHPEYTSVSVYADAPGLFGLHSKRIFHQRVPW